MPPLATETDAELVAAMRREERAALARFYARFAPLLHRCARLWGVRTGERETAVDDVLADVALALMRHTTPVPRSLAAYLATALRHHLGAGHRVDERRRRRVAERLDVGDAGDASGDGAASDTASLADAGAARALCSDHAHRAARGPAHVPRTPDPALVALAHHLERMLGDDDRLLLAWLAHHVPLRTAAGWLGVSYETARKRAQRLRARLRAATLTYLAALPPADRALVERVLARGDAAAPAVQTAITPPPSAQEHS